MVEIYLAGITPREEYPMASELVKTLTDANFEAEVLKSKTPTLVDFWAAWCVPCRQIAPIVEALAKEPSFSSRVQVGKLDIDHNQKVPTRFDVRSIPTLLLFHQGTVIGQLVGAVPRAKIEQFVKDALAKAGVSAQA
jgi:thioredoxin 1